MAKNRLVTSAVVKRFARLGDLILPADSPGQTLKINMLRRLWPVQLAGKACCLHIFNSK